LSKSSRALFAGLIVVAVLMVVRAVRISTLETRVSELQQQCEEEVRRAKNLPESDPAHWDQYLVCLALDLDDPAAPGVQGAMVRSAASLKWWENDAAELAVVVLALTGTPWVWYFALGRVRELGDAIRGRRSN